MLVKKQEKKWWTTKRKINTFLLGLFLFLFILVLALPLNFFLFGVPQISWTATGTVSPVSLETSEGSLPTVSYQFIVTFTAHGSYSVNNPIKTSVILYNVSIPNFLNYYPDVTFSNAYDSPFKYNADGFVYSALISLRSVGNNTYTGEGTIVWMIEGEAYGPIAWNGIGSVFMSELQTYPNVLPITSVSDTLTQVYTESALKITLLIGSFSPLILQPVVEAIVIKSDDKE